MTGYQTIRSKAYEVAAVLAADQGVNQLASAFVKAHGISKRGPHRMALQIQKLFTAEDIASWPPIGSKVSDFPQGYNGLTDHYDYQEYNGDKMVKRKGSFINDLADNASERGKAAKELLAKLSDCLKDNTPESVDSKLMALGATKLKAMRDSTHSELQAARRIFRDGIRVIQQVRAFDRFQSVRVLFDLDDKGEPTDSLSPIHVIDVAKPHVGRPFTVGGFLSLDPANAEDTYVSVTTTVHKKGADSDAGKGEALPKNTTEAMGMMNTLSTYFDKDDVRREWRRLLTGSSADRDAFLLAMFTLSEVCDDFMADQEVYRKGAELAGKPIRKDDLAAKQERNAA